MKGTGGAYAKRMRVIAITEARLGDSVICDRCGATLADFDQKCTRAFADDCPGFQLMDAVRMEAEREVGWP